MERALLQGERQAEQEQIEAESEIIAQLQHKLSDLENTIQRAKHKVGAEDANTHTHLYTQMDAHTHTNKQTYTNTYTHLIIIISHRPAREGRYHLDQPLYLTTGLSPGLSAAGLSAVSPITQYGCVDSSGPWHVPSKHYITHDTPLHQDPV